MWYLPSRIHNLEPTAIHNSSSVPVELEGCENVQFRCAFTEFLTGEKIPPINIHHHMQEVYGDKSADVSTVWCWIWQLNHEVRDASLCYMASVWEASDCNRWFEKIFESNRKTLSLNWKSLNKEQTTLSTFLDSEKFVPGGYNENWLMSWKLSQSFRGTSGSFWRGRWGIAMADSDR